MSPAEGDPAGAARSRRAFIKRALLAGGAFGARGALAPLHAEALTPQPPRIRSFDHVAIPGRRMEEMVAFYRALGMTVRERGSGYSIHFGDQKINLHAPSAWERDSFTLRAPSAVPPCGDFCWVFEGTRDELVALLHRADARIEAEGERDGGRGGGGLRGQSIYTRDPDGNLLEFIRYT